MHLGSTNYNLTSFMNFSKVQSIKLTLIMFSDNRWLEENAGNGQEMIFGDNIRFLNLEWKAVPMEKSQLFLYGEENGNDYRIRLYSEKIVSCDLVKYVSGEIRTNLGNNVYELQSIFRIESITERGPNTKAPSWVTENMEQVSDEKSEKKNLQSWSTEEVCHWAVNVLNIDNHEAQILKEENVDGYVLSKLIDQEMKALNVKFGTKIKLWEGIKNIQK
jgi:hypothetical protein